MDTNKHELKESEPILLKNEVYQIAGCAMTVLNTLGHGFFEKVYENALAVEMKAIDRITDAEKGQMLNYLKVTNLKVGLIFNFKHSKLEWQRMVL